MNCFSYSPNFYKIKNTLFAWLLLCAMFITPAHAQFVHSMGGGSFDEGIEVDLDAAGQCLFHRRIFRHAGF